MPDAAPDLTLTRFRYDVFGTFGQMTVGGSKLFTVERPSLGNAVRVSCIPEGIYPCRPRRYNAGAYDAIEIYDVPGRSLIMFHKANLPQELEGCIAPVSRLGCHRGQWGGLSSGAAFQILMDNFGGKEFTLQIVSDLTGG